MMQKLTEEEEEEMFGQSSQDGHRLAEDLASGKYETGPVFYKEGEEPDPEGWRKYSDIISDAQIEWLKKHPEHDVYGDVKRWDATQK